VNKYWKFQGKIITLSSFLSAPKKEYNLRTWAHSGHSRKNGGRWSSERGATWALHNHIKNSRSISNMFFQNFHIWIHTSVVFLSSIYRLIRWLCLIKLRGGWSTFHPFLRPKFQMSLLWACKWYIQEDTVIKACRYVFVDLNPCQITYPLPPLLMRSSWHHHSETRESWFHIIFHRRGNCSRWLAPRSQVNGWKQDLNKELAQLTARHYIRPLVYVMASWDLVTDTAK
jgi:hypothetical protein